MAKISNDKLIHLIPSVGEYQRELDSLNNQLGKTTLTGKISSLDVAETLFNYMEETQERFSKLQQSLVNSLIEESLNKVSGDIDSKVSTIASLWEATLSNREVDVALLAKKKSLKRFFENPENLENKKNVSEDISIFLQSYNVYKNVLLLNEKGKILFGQNAGGKNLTDPFIQEVFESTNLASVFFGESDLEPKDRYSLLYATRVVNDNDETLGIVVLPFNMQDEMSKVDQNETKAISTILTKDGIVLASTNPNMITIDSLIKPSKELALIKYKGIDYLSKSKMLTNTDSVIQIQSNVMIPLTQAFKKDSTKKELQLDEKLLENSHLISSELKDIRDQSEEINEDLIDVVINGEIIASKRRAYALNPILENIRIISERINVSFSSSIADIHDTIISSKLDEVSFRSATALDMLTRILFAQINDTKHVAAMVDVREALVTKGKDEEDVRKLTSALETINTLNNNYHNIFAFNTNGTILATSNASEGQMIGKGVDSDVIRRALSNGGGDYVMTSFTNSQSYNNQPTYIVAAPVKDEHNHIIGAVAIVLDGKSILASILKNSLPVDEEEIVVKGSYSMIVSREGDILSIYGSTELKEGDKLEIPANIYTNATQEGSAELLTIGKDYFAVGASAIKDYRGYKVEENKRNDIVALVFAKI